MDQRMSIVPVFFWSLLLVFLAYIAFVVREVLRSGADKATGIGVLPYVLTRPSFWLVALALSALVFWWKLR